MAGIRTQQEAKSAYEKMQRNESWDTDGHSGVAAREAMKQIHMLSARSGNSHAGTLLDAPWPDVVKCFYETQMREYLRDTRYYWDKLMGGGELPEEDVTRYDKALTDSLTQASVAAKALGLVDEAKLPLSTIDPQSGNTDDTMSKIMCEAVTRQYVRLMKTAFEELVVQSASSPRLDGLWQTIYRLNHEAVRAYTQGGRLSGLQKFPPYKALREKMSGYGFPADMTLPKVYPGSRAETKAGGFAEGVKRTPEEDPQHMR